MFITSLGITEDLIARQSPEAQVIIRILLAKIADIEARLNKTPQNSSLSPGSAHPHAKPQVPRSKSKKKSFRTRHAVSCFEPFSEGGDSLTSLRSVVSRD